MPWYEVAFIFTLALLMLVILIGDGNIQAERVRLAQRRLRLIEKNNIRARLRLEPLTEVE